ncbi:hypothetical protein Bbelb_196770 [Branchiostoma belcheri]|nr:hypothetical protein Bbelb_196770 [Branchiostoma belcheri]
MAHPPANVSNQARSFLSISEIMSKQRAETDNALAETDDELAETDDELAETDDELKQTTSWLKQRRTGDAPAPRLETLAPCIVAIDSIWCHSEGTVHYTRSQGFQPWSGSVAPSLFQPARRLFQPARRLFQQARCLFKARRLF